MKKGFKYGLVAAGVGAALVYWETATKVVVTNRSSSAIDVSIGLEMSQPVWRRRIAPGETAWLWQTIHETGMLQVTLESEGGLVRRDLGYVNPFLSGSTKLDIRSRDQMDADRIPSALSVLAALLPA
jgi:hypothetical protein